MAEVEKFTDDGVMMLLKHSDRQLKNDSNKDILEKRKDLNYSIPVQTEGLTAREFYQKLLAESYLYGRGTRREEEAVTCCSWVITLPRSVSDYSHVNKEVLTRIHPDEEKQFFNGVTRFVSERYGTVFYNRVHYDEGGQPHVHIYFVPRTRLDHDVIHYKTVKTHEPIQTESGRYEFQIKFKLDANGDRIPLKNYAKLSDYYDSKISGADVLNKAELQHFHQDLADFLKKNNLPGADSVHTGKTRKQNISVSAMKEFTRNTSKTIEELREHPLTQDVLRELLSSADLRPADRRVIEAINTDATIQRLQETIQKQAASIQQYNQTLEQLQKEYANALNRIKELEAKTVTMEQVQDQEWGKSSDWGNQATSSWGNREQSFNYDKEV